MREMQNAEFKMQNYGVLSEQFEIRLRRWCHNFAFIISHFAFQSPFPQRQKSRWVHGFIVAGNGEMDVGTQGAFHDGTV